MTRPTHADFIEHVKTGIGDNCLVCDCELVGEWTDYNGEIKCSVCGMTYQILGSHFTDEFLSKNRLSPLDVARRYCPDFEEVPIFRAYWNEAHRQLPLGTYLVSARISKDDHLAFIQWLADHAPEIEPLYADSFNWEMVKHLVTAGGETGAR
jgi:hypothetical protein